MKLKDRLLSHYMLLKQSHFKIQIVVTSKKVSSCGVGFSMRKVKTLALFHNVINISTFHLKTGI